MTDPRCGTPGTKGLQAHRAAGTEVCQPCRDAYNAYVRERYRDPKVRDRHNRRKEAADRAKRRLAKEYPERYRQLVNEELRRDQP